MPTQSVYAFVECVCPLPVFPLCQWIWKTYSLLWNDVHLCVCVWVGGLALQAVSMDQKSENTVAWGLSTNTYAVHHNQTHFLLWTGNHWGHHYVIKGLVFHTAMSRLFSPWIRHPHPKCFEVCRLVLMRSSLIGTEKGTTLRWYRV